MTPSSSNKNGRDESFAVPLADEFSRPLIFQNYEPQSPIHGVATFSVQKHRADNGWFAEIFRLEGGISSAPLNGLDVRQVSAAYAQPFRINGFHIHPRVHQDEAWIVLQGAMTVWLIDCRRDTPTPGARQRVQLAAEEPSMLFIPAGVAHGYRAGRDGALLLYGMNQQFDKEEPNEGRLPWDYFGADIWDEDRG